MGSLEHGSAAVAEANRATAGRVKVAKRAKAAKQTSNAKQANLPAHLTQSIKSAEEAKAWLAQHAGVQVALPTHTWQRVQWNGPTAHDVEDAQGARHGLSVESKQELIRAAKGIQAYMREHPAGSPDAYQTTHEGAYRDTMRRIEAATRHGATPEERAAAQVLHEAFARHQALYIPSLAHDMTEYDLSKPVGQDFHGKTESPSAQLARFKIEQEALRLLPSLAPQLALRADFAADLASAQKSVGERISKAQLQVNQRAERIGELVSRLKSANAEQRDAFTAEHARSWHNEAPYFAEHKAAVLKGQAALLKQMEKNPEAFPVPLKAPKKESAAAQEARAIANRVIYDMWHDAVRYPTFYREYKITGYQRHADSNALTRTEDWAMGHTVHASFKTSEGIVENHAKAFNEQRAAQATAQGRAAAQGHPMIESLKAGKSLLVREGDGSLRVIVPSYDATQRPEAGGALHTTAYGSVYVTHGASNHVHSYSTTPAGFYNDHLAPDAPSPYTLVGTYKSKVAAFNGLRSQPEHAPRLFEAAKRNHLYASEQLERAKAKLTEARASAKAFESWYTNQGMTPPPIEQSNGVKSARAELLTAERRVAKAEASVRNLQRLLENTGQRPKTPRARKA